MLLHKASYGLGRAGRERRVIVALLQDLFCSEGLMALSVAVSVSLVIGSDCSSPGSGVCAVGDDESVRGDLRGGAESGIGEEHLFGV